MTNPYGTTKAAEVMLWQDRQSDLLKVLTYHLLAYPLPNPEVQASTLTMLDDLNRRVRR